MFKRRYFITGSPLLSYDHVPERLQERFPKHRVAVVNVGSVDPGLVLKERRSVLILVEPRMLSSRSRMSENKEC